MKRFTEARETSSRRFCRAHRLELLQGDIKYGPVIVTKEGKKIKTYLSSLIDDHSRLNRLLFRDSEMGNVVTGIEGNSVTAHEVSNIIIHSD